MLLKKIVIGMICIFSALNVSANNKTLTSFDELLQALDGGNKVRAVINIEKCKVISGAEIIKERSLGFDYDWYNHYEVPVDAQHSKEVITTSKNIFSVTTIQNLGAINNYVKLHVMKDNSVYLYWSLLDPKTYAEKATITFNCPLNADANHAGLLLYQS